MKKQNLIIGLGTGRCGTTSLANLLTLQDDSIITHELEKRHNLTWNVNHDGFNCCIETFEETEATFVGDVALFWLSYTDSLIKYDNNVKFVILKRDKQKTVDSLYKLTRYKNPWLKKSIKSNWSPDDNNVNSMNQTSRGVFPTYNIISKRDCISKYYDEYYEECLKLDQSRTFWLDTEDLNDKEKTTEMLKFCGFPNPKYTKVKVNTIEHVKNSHVRGKEKIINARSENTVTI